MNSLDPKRSKELVEPLCLCIDAVVQTDVRDTLAVPREIWNHGRKFATKYLAKRVHDVLPAAAPCRITIASDECLASFLLFRYSIWPNEG